jgi:hypothetical protein
MTLITVNGISEIDARKSCFRVTLKDPSALWELGKTYANRHLPELVAAHCGLDSSFLETGCLDEFLPMPVPIQWVPADLTLGDWREPESPRQHTRLSVPINVVGYPLVGWFFSAESLSELQKAENGSLDRYGGFSLAAETPFY